MQIVGSELARDSEVKIACKQASYTRTPIGSRVHEENRQQLHDPG
jgi:hypothetical protein